MMGLQKFLAFAFEYLLIHRHLRAVTTLFSGTEVPKVSVYVMGLQGLHLPCLERSFHRSRSALPGFHNRLYDAERRERLRLTVKLYFIISSARLCVWAELSIPLQHPREQQWPRCSPACNEPEGVSCVEL